MTTSELITEVRAKLNATDYNEFAICLDIAEEALKVAKGFEDDEPVDFTELNRAYGELDGLL